MKIQAYNMKDGKTILLTTETPNFFNGDYDSPIIVTQLSACDDWLIYSIGYHEGSGNYFHGDLYRIKKDGSGKELLRINNKEYANIEFDSFTVLDNRIIYNNISVESNQDTGYSIMQPDMSDMKKLDESVYSIIGAIDGFLYYQTEMGDIHRCKIDLSEDRLILKSKDLPNFITDEDGYYYDINVINDTMYFDAAVWGSRSGYGWRDQFIDSTFNMINLDGTGLKTLTKVSSEFDGKDVK